MSKKPIIEKCGRSGVELHEIRRNVNAEGEDTTSRGKPGNPYLDGKKKSGKGGWSGARMISHGFGPSKFKNDQSMPKLSGPLSVVLVMIDEVAPSIVAKKELPAIKLLEKKGYVTWSDRDKCWKTMAEGRRVAELIKEGK